ncbi:O-antigen polysaccharide polymerase Wzy [Aeromonas sp. QDB18]|uniref:O-antigen polysaccharide polymerase Wzy n=1 Tax=Aeromonas sp. QDB18 TaxID=2990486 RepID=UPI0022E3F931|nr:O-antigen polysaccharide polymerase Wzy [Aeromonas sp. QDB18]
MYDIKRQYKNSYIQKGISILLVFVFFIFIYTLLFIGNDVTHVHASILSMTTLAFVFFLCRLNKVKINSIITFFYISIVFFIFGRFVAVSFSSVFGVTNGLVNSLTELLQVTWMTSFSPNQQDQLMLVFLVNSFLLFMTLGYISPVQKNSYEQKNEFHISAKTILFLKFLFLFSCFINGISTIKAIISTLSGGYLALYQNQMDGGGSSSILGLIYFVSFAVLVVVEKNNKKYFLIYLIMAILSGFTGARGGLVTALLTLLYVYYLTGEKKISFIKLLFLGIFCYFFMMFVFQFSARADGSSTDSDVLNAFLNFIYSQGISLSVVGYISFADLEYPIQSLLQSFIPMASRVFLLFFPNEPFYNSSITTFISHSANSAMFFNGAGLGSSIIGELYILSGKAFTVFSLLSFLLGFGVRKIELKSVSNVKARVFIVAMFPILLFSPRNGFNVLFISAIYIFIMIMVFFLIAKSKGHYQQ